MGRGTGQHAAQDLVQIHLGESHAKLQNAGKRGHRGGTRPFPFVPEGQQIFELLRGGQSQPRLEFGRSPETPVLFPRQSAPARIFHDEVNLLRDVFRRIRHAVRAGFLPVHHGIERSFVRNAAVGEPRRIVAQAIHQGKDIPDGGEIPALVFVRFRRLR